MQVIPARNVNNALAHGLRFIRTYGLPETSRNGPVLVASLPVVTQYYQPMERVLFSPTRDANPFFHFFESLWMLAGHNDLDFPQYFNSNFKSYSDDGHTVRGAYGHRWRNWFGYDQLEEVIRQLVEDPSTRRAVLTMWDAGATAYGTGNHQWPEKGDLLATSKDKPCNTHIYFRVVHNKLDMTVCNRSNDIYWGAYGANAVHMSMLQEFVAGAIGKQVGMYFQLSNNYHLYTDVVPEEKAEQIIGECEALNLYYTSSVKPYPIFTGLEHEPAAWAIWLDALRKWFKQPTVEDKTMPPFFYEVATPMYDMFKAHKTKSHSVLTAYLEDTGFIKATDWRMAATQWITKRRK